MRDNMFWRGMAIVALVLGFLFVGSRMMESKPVRAAQDSLQVISAPDTAKAVQLYIVDSSRDVILVYGTGRSSADNFSLIAGRSMRYDREVASRGELPFHRSRGYSVKDMKKEAEKRN